MRLNISKIRRLMGSRPQWQIAKACGLAQPNLSRCLAGRHAPTLATIEKLAKGLRVKARDLLLALALIAALVALLACGRSDPPPAAPSRVPPPSAALRPLLAQNPLIALAQSLQENPTPPDLSATSVTAWGPPGNQRWLFSHEYQVVESGRSYTLVDSKVLARLTAAQPAGPADLDAVYEIWRSRLARVILPREIAAARSALEQARIEQLKNWNSPWSAADSGRFETRCLIRIDPRGGVPTRVMLELSWLSGHDGWLAWQEYQSQPLRLSPQRLYTAPAPATPSASPPPPDPVGIIPPP